MTCPLHGIERPCHICGVDFEADRHWTDLGREVGVICLICDQPAEGRQLCQRHYRRHLRATRNEAALINRDARRAS
jgi:hypothetical protein